MGTLRKKLPCSEETKRKISLAKMGHIVSEATRQKIRAYRHSPERRLKMSQAKIGKPSPRRGAIMSDESKRKISESKKGTNTGETNHRWIVDRTLLKKTGDSEKDRRSSAYVTWRRQVWLRDNFKCKIDNPDCLGRIEAHHILGYTEYPELRYKINNGITLCHAHHPKKRAEEKRLSPYFQSLVAVSEESI